MIELLSPLDDADTRWCVEAERAFSRELAGSCTVPLGGFAEISGKKARLRGFVASVDGSRLLHEELTWSVSRTPQEFGSAVAQRLIARGAREILAGVQSS